MFFPNESIHTEILHEAAGVWFVESEGDDTHAILLKLPSNVLKAVIGGCQLKLSFAVVRTNNSNLLVSCAHIYDDKSAPLMVLNPHSNPADQKALFEILQRPSTPIFLYDELCRNVAWAASKWSEQPTNLMIMLSSISSSDVSHSSKEIQYALDCLQFSLDSSINIPDVEQVKLQQLELILTNFDTIDIYSYSVNDGAMRFNAADRDEGGGFEQSVWQLLESVFLRQIYKSPYVIESQSRKREFTDVFCLSEFGVFLIEAKAASVYNTDPDRDTGRRAKNLEKQLKKAINQLCGGFRVIEKTQQIFSREGVEIKYNGLMKHDGKLIPHGIIVISEKIPAVNWNDIFFLLVKSALKTQSMIHILDLQELREYVGHSKSANQFDHYLMQRFEVMVKRKQAFIKTKFVKRPDE